MPGSTFGHAFRVTTFGESHGAGVGCVIDGCPPGIAIDWQAVQAALQRRRPGQSKLVTPRNEADELECLSGIHSDGRSLGSPIAILVRNADQRSKSYEDWHHIYRPSHADWSYDAKYGLRAWQGGGRASARETIGRVAAGAIAEQVFCQLFPNAHTLAWVEQIHDIGLSPDLDPLSVTREAVEAHPTRMPEAAVAQEAEKAILSAKSQGDSLGGAVRLCMQGIPPGLGSPVFDKLDAVLAQAMMSLPAVKAVEIGSGGNAISMTGLSHNDPFAWQDGHMTTTSNRSGGIQGGISNGMPINMRIVFKPTATVLQPQDSADDAGNNVPLQAKGRHDPCVLPRAVPIVEAMAWLTVVDALLQQRGQVGHPWPGLQGPIKGQG